MRPLIAMLLIAAYAVSTKVIAQNDIQSAENASSEASTQALRERIALERAQVQQRFSQQEAVCYQKFAVNSCREDSRIERNEALGELRRQEITLNQAERRRKGALQHQLTEDKSQRASEREAALPDQTAASEPAPAAKQRAPATARKAKAPGAAPTAKAPSASQDQKQAQRSREAAAREAKALAAAQNQARYDAKLGKVQADKEAAAQRAAQRSKPAASSLPTPPN